MGRLTQRPRLDRRLDESLEDGCRLVLVTAPAGFGKSTLIGTWIRQQPTPYAWLSLEKSDNEPRLFLSYLVGAFQKIDANLGASLVNRIQTADSADSEAVYLDVIACLVNEISLLPDSFVLVLDDCHVLKNPFLLKLLIFLIERQPPQMRLVLLTREDLPLPISRLRVRRQVVEIRQADLQFNANETESFLREGMDIQHLTPEDIEVLEQRTEGWIAGLQLAALSLKNDPNPAEFIQSFAGSDRYVLDYLLDEVFSHQPEDIQNFLLSTSILDRLCAPLCEVVFAEMVHQPVAGAQGLLAQVEHANLFLIPLDYHREWYRYHHLFADLLRHALSQAAPKQVPGLHLRASQWLESNGHITEAVKHAFQSRDWLYAAELVERHAWNVILHSQVATVSEWCATFPEAMISKRPALCIFHCWALIIAFKKANFPAANVRLAQAEAALAAIDPELRADLVNGAPPVRLHAWVTGQATLLRSFIMMAEPRAAASPEALMHLGQLSYEQLPAEDIPARSASLLDICYALQARCEVEKAEQQYEQVVSIALSGGNYFGAVVAEYHRAHGLLTQGRLWQVIEFCQQKRKTYQALFEHPMQDLPAIALLDQAEGCALLELNKLEEAEQYLRRGLEVGQWMPREELPAYLGLARLCAAKGDQPGMAETLRRLDMRWPDISYCTQAMRVVYKLKVAPDEPETRLSAARWAASQALEIGPGIVLPGIGPAWNDEADYALFTAWAQVQLLLSCPDQAVGVIQPLLDVAQEHGLLHRVIELTLLKAQALWLQDQKESAWGCLQLALGLAEEQGYLRLIDQGPLLVALLQAASRKGIETVYIGRLLSANQAAPDEPRQQAISSRVQPGGHPQAPAGVLLEPLSTREVEVLALMAEGLSNAEIAGRLYLSTNTLKSHTQNIYGKLEVHSRVQAVNKARELRLID
jgi:LuxR family transcriptional regulator, maltose regulon positive regulatory protein